MPPLVIFLIVLVTLTRSSYSTSLSSSGSGNGGKEVCIIELNECRPPQQRLLKNITELGLSLNESLPRPAQPPVITDAFDPFIYMIELNELIPPSLGINSHVLRISSINLTSFERLHHQVNLKHNLSFVDFACSKVNLSIAWIVNETHSEFSPSVTLCLDSGVPGPVTSLTHEIEGRENCSQRNEAIITFNWAPPEDNYLLSHYMLLLVPAESTMSSLCLTYNESISNVGQNHSVILQFPCTYSASLISYPGAHSKQIDVTTIPKPSLDTSCSSLFDQESMHYNVTAEFTVSPNNCLVIGRITTYVLKIYKYRNSLFFATPERLGAQLDQKDIETDGAFQNSYKYTFTNFKPLRPDHGYVIEVQTKFQNISTSISGGWSIALTERDCISGFTPPIAPEKIKTVNITNFRLSNNSIASFTIKWDQPLRPNGNITEYQIRVLNRENTELISPINDIPGNTQEYDISFFLPMALNEISVQVRSTNNWCQEITQCYSDWSDAVTGGLVTASTSSISPSTPIPSVTRTPVDDGKSTPFSLLWLLIGSGVLSLILVVVIAIIVVVCCQHGWCCIKRDFPMDPPINITESGIIPLLQIKRPVMDEWEIPREILEVRKDQTLGSGCFGEVFKGYLQKNYVLTKRRLSHDHYLHSRRGSLPQETYPVAVKKLKSIADGKEKSDFLKEIEVMKTVSSTDSDLRRFVVNMLGCCSLEEPMLLVVEFVENGDLLNYLRRMKRKAQGNNSALPPAPYLEPLGTYSLLEPKSELDNEGFLTERNLIDFSRQIASGMEYLSSLGIIHRDLACRNVLVGKEKNLKISDFGLSRVVLSDMVYTLTNHGRLPIRWMALESIFQREFTTSSDVWSYGVALWEICTMGAFPYATMQEKELLKLLKKGYRLPKPQNCSQDMFEVMHQCWHPDPHGRPTFSNLHKLFDYFLSRHTQELYPYIDMDCNVPYTYDHLTHKSITDYKKDETEEAEEEILYIEDDEEVREIEESNDCHSPKDLSTTSSNEKLLDESTQSSNISETQTQEDSAYDKLRVDHPFLVRMSGQKNGSHDPQAMLHDDYFEDYIEENIEDYCLRAFEEYNPIWLKKLSTITEASCEDYDENS